VIEVKLYLNVAAIETNVIDAHIRLLNFYNVISLHQNHKDIEKINFKKMMLSYHNHKKMISFKNNKRILEECFTLIESSLSKKRVIENQMILTRRSENDDDENENENEKDNED